MFENRLFVELGCRAVIVTHDYRGVSAWAAHDLMRVYTLNSSKKKGTTGANTVAAGLVFREAVRVPRHAFSPNSTGALGTPLDFLVKLGLRFYLEVLVFGLR